MPRIGGVASVQAGQVHTAGVWLGGLERPLAGWLSRPASGSTGSGIVLLPPVGYPYWCSHRTLRVLAETLAGQGHTVLRIDYDGTGDSAGDQWDGARLSAWRASVRVAVRELREMELQDLELPQITLIGARLGATLALLEAEALAVERVVAWAPVISGRRYVKATQLLGTEVPQQADPLDPPGTIVSTGSVFSRASLDELAGLSLEGLSLPSRQRTLVLDAPSARTERWVMSLRERGADVEYRTLLGGEQALETPPELGSVPEPIIEAISAWVGSVSQRPGPPARRARSTASFVWRGTRIHEEISSFGESGYVGVLSSPPHPDPARSTLVLLNGGSESHVGPGRAWVEYARDLAALGYRSVRVDLRGWGESPDGGRAPGRPYDLRGVQDTIEIARALGQCGHPRVVLMGLCASAWIALRAVVCAAPVVGAIALNPQMYWQPGDPVEIDWDQIRARREREIRTIQRGQRWHAWDVLDVLGHHHPAASWLEALSAIGVPVRLLFSERDDGLLFLEQRLSRRLRRVVDGGRVTVRELAGVDHPMHRAWMRPLVAAALHEALMGIDIESGAAEHPPRARPQLPALELVESR